SRQVILVVDDDASLRSALQLILGEKYQVLEAADAASALGTIGVRPVDLVLLDLLLQRGDGIEVLESLKATGRIIPVIVMSGLNTSWTAATAMRLGALDYVTKPFDEDE